MSSVFSQPHKVIQSLFREDFHQPGKRNVSSTQKYTTQGAVCMQTLRAAQKGKSLKTRMQNYSSSSKDVGNLMFHLKNYSSISQSVVRSVFSLQME